MSDSTCTPDECCNSGPRGGKCDRCYAREYRAANLEKSREQERLRAQRVREKHSERINAGLREAYAADPEKYKARVREHRAKNYDRVIERERIKNAKYRAENVEKMRELVREASKRWRRENALKVREYCRARRARMAGGKVDYAAILAEFGMVCHLCGLDIPTLADLHMDHVVPLALGGPHSAENIRPAHAFCNLSKGARV